MNFTDRISILEFCNQEFPDGYAIEIGVAGGHFSKQIHATWKNLKYLHCVDPWVHFDEGYDDPCNLSQEVQDERCRQFSKDAAALGKIMVIRMTSQKASGFFKPCVGDFIYLDANHSYEAVKQDLDCWWPVLKSGGIFAGHDYQSGNGKGHGVKQAVDEFSAKMNLTVHSTTQEFCRPEGIYGAGWEGCSFVLRKE